MEKGDIIVFNGERFKVQKIVTDSLYASKMQGDKCQRGKPKRIFFKDLAENTGKSVNELKQNVKSVVKSKLAESIDLNESEDAKEAEDSEEELDESDESSDVVKPKVPSKKKDIETILKSESSSTAAWD